MSGMSHAVLRESFKNRIVGGEWKPGALIPAEEILASDYGCSRTTVNRALQALAETGLIERRRGAGTRVKLLPVRQAQFTISVVRDDIEAAGAVYGHRILLNKKAPAPAYVRKRLHLSEKAKALHILTVHLADGRPHAYEDRWVNIAAAPAILTAPLAEISANEWLVREIPYTSGDIAFTAVQVTQDVAEMMETPAGAALLCVDRTTWLGKKYVTTMKLYYRPGYALQTTL